MAFKSYKREIAAASMGLVAVGAASLFFMDDVDKIKALIPLITGLGSTVVVMGLGVFGLHAMLGPKKDGT